MNRDLAELIYATNYAQGLLPAMLDLGRQWGVIDGVKGALVPNIPDIFLSAPYVCQNIWGRRMKYLADEADLARMIGLIFSCCYAGIGSVLLWNDRKGKRETLEMLNELLSAFPINDFDNSILRKMGIEVGSREHGDFNCLMLGVISTSKEKFAQNPIKFEQMKRGAGIAMSWFGMAYMIHRLGIKGVNC